MDMIILRIAVVTTAIAGAWGFISAIIQKDPLIVDYIYCRNSNVY